MRGLLAFLALAACTAAEIPVTVPPVSRGTVRIRSFTEPTAARHLEVVGSSVFVVTGHGLERWARGGQVTALSSQAGLPSDDILSVVADAERKALWILQPGSLGRYHVGGELFETLEAPEPELGLDLAALQPGDRTALAPAGPHGVWVGTPTGLFRGDAEGWSATPIHDAVVALTASEDGLLVASSRGLLRLDDFGDVAEIGAAEGCLVAHPQRLVAAPRLGGTLVFGSDERGAARVAIGRGQRWHSFRVLPGLEILDAAAAGDEVLLLGEGQLFRLSLRNLSEPRPLARDGVRLAAMSSAAPDLAITSMPALLPAGSISVAISGEHVLVGTRDTGVARYLDGEVRPSSWLRRRQMFAGASALSVACASRDDCWVATGARSAWHWTGNGFTAGGPEALVLAVVRDRAGAIIALHREVGDSAIQLSRLDADQQWTALPKLELAVPGSEPEVRFARFAASGALWIGVGYRDDQGARAWGVAILNLASGRGQLHPAGGAPVVGKKLLPIPRGVRDADVHGDDAWFATDEGVAKLTVGALSRWRTSSGLRSEQARAIAVSRTGTVFVATGAGVGRYDGERWRFPPQLGFEVSDLTVTSGGQLWMATPRGIAVYDGAKVRRIDLRRGLVENDVLDLAVDRFDRIWGRGAGSLTLVAP